MTNNQVSGGISGAITNLDSKEAQEYAIQAYERIRNNQHDIEKIAKNLNIEERIISAIKWYLFYEKCVEGENGKKKRFDPSFAIAQSWNRLAYEPENIQEHDRILIQHEIMEMKKVVQDRIPQSEAHEMTSQSFDYRKASEDYYKKLREMQKHSHKETDVDVETMEYLKSLANESEKREDSKNRLEISGTFGFLFEDTNAEQFIEQEKIFKERFEAIQNVNLSVKPKTNAEKLQQFCKKALMQHYTDDYTGYMVEGVKQFLLATPNVKLCQMTGIIDDVSPVAAFDSEKYRYSDFLTNSIRQDKYFRKQLANRGKTLKEISR